MLSELELKKYYAEHDLSRDAIEFIEESISAPSRLVGTKADGNVCTDFVSSKSGFSVQTESRGPENSFAIMYEFSNSVLIFFDQPALVMVLKTYKNGVKRHNSYTSDFLVFDVSGPYVVETKTLEELQKLHTKNPDDWLFTNGEYIYKPAKDKFKELGLTHIVRSTAELSSIRIENLRLLLYARESNFALTNDIEHKTINAFKDNAWMRLSNLLEKLGSKDTTPIFLMILREKLFVNIDEELLSYPESVWISPSKELLDICKHNQELDINNNPLLSTEIEIELNRAPNFKQAQRALRRLERVEQNENSSSVRRYKRKISDGVKKGLSPFESLLDNSHKQGNYKCKMPPVVKRTLINFLCDKYPTPTRLINKSAHAIYKYIAKKKHPSHDPVSRNTFFAYKRQENQIKIAYGRGGRRPANAAKNPTEVMKREIRGTVPFTFASLDHYLADIFLVLAVVNGKIYSFRPWISALVDYTTRHTLAYWVSLRAPSCRSCAMVLRQCVRTFGMLPNEILVDGGKEFNSVYFKALLAMYRVNRVLRPAEDPKYGSEAERSFGEMKTQWLSLLPGNIVEYVENRSISKSHSAEKTARLKIHDFIEQAPLYLEWKNNSLIGDAMYSPSMELQRGIERYPFVGRKINYDEEFIVKSAVDVRNYTVDPSRGINIDGRHFWHPRIKELAARKKPGQTKLEPEDPYKIYTNINDKWVTCIASGEQKFLSQNPNIRAAEAIRINDGRAFRDKIKEESEQILIETILEKEPKPIDKSELYLPQKEILTTQEPLKESVFSEVMDLEIEPLESNKWSN